MKKLVTRRTVVVEGRYDAVKVNGITDANIVVVDGFAIYSDKEKQQLLKRLAKHSGLILLLDSDGAGFRMRHYITGLVGEENVLQIYTPAVKGKEKRKETAGKEGLLGVEGIDTAVLYDLFAAALAKDDVTLVEGTVSQMQGNGVDMLQGGKQENDCAAVGSATNEALTGGKVQTVSQGAQAQQEPPRQVTYTDLFRWGFSGTAGSSERKTAFLQSLGLPPRLSKKELVNVLNKLYTYQELEDKQKAMFG